MLIRKLNEGRMSGQKAFEAEGGTEKKHVQGPGAAISPVVSREGFLLLGRQPMCGPRVWPADYRLPMQIFWPITRLLSQQRKHVHSHMKPLLVVQALEEQLEG